MFYKYYFMRIKQYHPPVGQGGYSFACKTVKVGGFSQNPVKLYREILELFISDFKDSPDSVIEVVAFNRV